MEQEKNDRCDSVRTKTETVEFEAHIPGGMWGIVRGMGVGPILATIVAVLLFLALYAQSRDNRTASMDRDALTQRMLGEVVTLLGDQSRFIQDGQRRIERAQYLQTWVMTRTEAQRQALRLETPDEFRGVYGLYETPAGAGGRGGGGGVKR